ncbi:MAG: class I SAM-dependent methyltransferase, partial [Minisyncoccales bacterium]
AISFLDPQKIVNSLPLTKEMVAADFGCGTGGWVIPLARILSEGIVYAIDVQETPLSSLTSKINLEGLSNIKKILADVENNIKALSDNSCDLVIMSNLLFQVEDKKNVFKQANRVLKPGGLLLVVDWKEDAVIGPAEGMVAKDEVEKIAQEMDFILEKEIDAGSYHYGILFRKM